jgi:uncharacterized protein
MEPETESPSPPPPPAASAGNQLPPALPPARIAGPSDEERTMAMLCHLLGIFTGFIGPLVIWLVRKNQSAFIDHHGRESLNFQITLLLVTLGLFGMTIVLMFFLVGLLLLPVLFVLPLIALVFEILAAIAAQRGDWHRYPFNIRLV